MTHALRQVLRPVPEGATAIMNATYVSTERLDSNAAAVAAIVGSSSRSENVGRSDAFQRAGSNHIGSVPGASPVMTTPGRKASLADVLASGAATCDEGASWPFTY